MHAQPTADNKQQKQLHSFTAQLDIIGINPFVFVPDAILAKLFAAAGKNKGHIPICGTINNVAYKQTLVKYSGHWRLYINTSMLKNSPKRIGETISVGVTIDNESRAIAAPAAFVNTLNNTPLALAVYNTLPPSRQHEINRYLARLKSDEVLEKNIVRAINFLLGKESFAGRAKP
jgi:hypothetical protein